MTVNRDYFYRNPHKPIDFKPDYSAHGEGEEDVRPPQWLQDKIWEAVRGSAEGSNISGGSVPVLEPIVPAVTHISDIGFWPPELPEVTGFYRAPDDDLA